MWTLSDAIFHVRPTGEKWKDTMSSDPPTLRKVLTVSQAVGLALTIVVGSGLLVLPGLGYRNSGGAAIYVWLLDLALVAPLLIVFAKLGGRWPSAGGIAGFCKMRFHADLPPHPRFCWSALSDLAFPPSP